MPLALRRASGSSSLVVVTSLVAVRRRFPYEAWHAIHLLSYVAVAGRAPPPAQRRQVLAEGTFERVYWIALYVLAFGSIAWFRFLVPLVGTLRHRIRVVGGRADRPRGRPRSTCADGISRRLGARGRSVRDLAVLERGNLVARPPDLVLGRALPTRTRAHHRPRLGAGTGRLGPPAAGHSGLDRGALRPLHRRRPAPLPTRDHRRRDRDHARRGRSSSTRDARAPARRRSCSAARDRRRRPTCGTRWRRSRIANGSEALHDGRPPSARASTPGCRRTSISRGVTLIESVFPDLLESDLYVCGPPVWTDLVVRGRAAPPGSPSTRSTRRGSTGEDTRDHREHPRVRSRPRSADGRLGSAALTTARHDVDRSLRDDDRLGDEHAGTGTGGTAPPRHRRPRSRTGGSVGCSRRHLHRHLRAHPLRRRPGADHRQRWSDHRRDRPAPHRSGRSLGVRSATGLRRSCGRRCSPRSRRRSRP